VYFSVPGERDIDSFTTSLVPVPAKSAAETTVCALAIPGTENGAYNCHSHSSGKRVSSWKRVANSSGVRPENAITVTLGGDFFHCVTDRCTVLPVCESKYVKTWPLLEKSPPETHVAHGIEVPQNVEPNHESIWVALRQAPNFFLERLFQNRSTAETMCEWHVITIAVLPLWASSRAVLAFLESEVEHRHTLPLALLNEVVVLPPTHLAVVPRRLQDGGC
jgi:hypothetical protein